MPTTGWAGALAALDQARSQAFATGDVGRLLSVYAPAAPALRRDRRALHELTRAGLRAFGLRLTTTSVRLRARTAGQVQLAVTDQLQSYRMVDDDGHVVQRRPGRGERSWTVVLARSGDRWRVYDVLRG
jgi:hypothetical protein